MCCHYVVIAFDWTSNSQGERDATILIGFQLPTPLQALACYLPVYSTVGRIYLEIPGQDFKSQRLLPTVYQPFTYSKCSPLNTVQ